MVQTLQPKYHEPCLVAVRISNKGEPFEVYGISVHGSKDGQQTTILIPTRWIIGEQFHALMDFPADHKAKIEFSFIMAVIDSSLIIDSISSEQICGITEIIQEYQEWLKERESSMMRFELEEINEKKKTWYYTSEEALHASRMAMNSSSQKSRKREIVRSITSQIEEGLWIQNNTTF